MKIGGGRFRYIIHPIKQALSNSGALSECLMLACATQETPFSGWYAAHTYRALPQIGRLGQLIHTKSPIVNTSTASSITVNSCTIDCDKLISNAKRQAHESSLTFLPYPHLQLHAYTHCLDSRQFSAQQLQIKFNEINVAMILTTYARQITTATLKRTTRHCSSVHSSVSQLSSCKPGKIDAVSTACQCRNSVQTLRSWPHVHSDARCGLRHLCVD